MTQDLIKEFQQIEWVRNDNLTGGNINKCYDSLNKDYRVVQYTDGRVFLKSYLHGDGSCKIWKFSRLKEAQKFAENL